MSWRPRLKNIFTVVYLISAFMVTAATSKMPPGGTPAAFGLKGITNYSVQSGCPSQADIVAFRVERGSITQTLASDGTLNTTSAVDFTQFGFPNKRVVVGMDQYGADTSKRKCYVRSKDSQTNPKYDQAQSSYWFVKPGDLTTVLYDCYDSGNYTCSISLSELPAGDLKSATQN